MSSDDFAIRARDLGRCYQIYHRPIDRLKQSLWGGKRQFFDEHWALKSASFDIRKGETVGVIGSNGSGKSTLLQMICGILSPTLGELSVNGRIAALLELGAGFNPEFTGGENIRINAAIMGLSKREIESRFEDIVSFADIGRYIDQPVKTYSSGMYVRLAFATAINVSPDILLVDEALAVGDVRFQQKCMARIKDFCRKGTVVFVSHNTAAVTELCSRVIWIERGEVRMDGPPKFVVENYLQYMYEGVAGPEKTGEKGGEGDADVTLHSDTEQFAPLGADVRQFGNRRAEILALRVGNGSHLLRSGEPCEISLLLKAHAEIAHPIIGYLVKDRYGRILFADNTALMGQPLNPMAPGKAYIFSFQMNAWPNIADDEYTLSLAIADGTMEEHQQCHYLHDGMVIKSVAARPCAGIFSVLETEVLLKEAVE